jgi:hypothetical protein
MQRFKRDTASPLALFVRDFRVISHVRKEPSSKRLDMIEGYDKAKP